MDLNIKSENNKSSETEEIIVSADVSAIKNCHEEVSEEESSSSDISKTPEKPTLKLKKFASNIVLEERKRLNISGKVFKKSSNNISVDVTPFKKRENLNSTIKILNCCIPYKVCGHVILFKTNSVYNLINENIPLKSDLRNNSDRSGKKLAYLNDVWKRPFLSWNTLKVVLNDIVIDQALRDVINFYSPYPENHNESSEVGDEEVSQKNSKTSSLKIGNHNISYRIFQGSKIYLDILGKK